MRTMSTDRPLRLAVLGLGFMGSTHLKALRSIPAAHVLAVLEQDATRLSGDLSAVRGNLGGPGERMDFSGVKQYREIAPLLADPDIDAVDICLPTDSHAEIAMQALRAGKHVLVEKPMALDGASADRMVEEAERSGRVLMTGHVLRFSAAYGALRGIVRTGEMGPPRFATFRRRCAAPRWGGWLQDPAKSGGGAFDLLIHDADICLHVFGKPEFVAATGFLDAAAGIDCLDAQLYYPGAIVTMTGGWHNPGEFPFSMEFTTTFQRGTIDYHSSRTGPILYGSDGTERAMVTDSGDSYAAELEYFVTCCLKGRAPEICPPRESADAVKLMLLILEARKRNGEKIACRI
jgi:predicted dehydrogenase